MKKNPIMSLAVLALMAAGQSAFATSQAPGYYKCSNVGGVQEYDIEVNLYAKKAAFFDNDSWSEIKLLGVTNLESLPPQTVYLFEGKDAYGADMRISFNQTKLNASVTENIGTPKEDTMTSSKCVAVRRQDLGSGI